MRKSLAEYPDQPIFNMKAVEQKTGISAATLRAWERRYSLVEPQRTASGYRLYSARDVALLTWVHDRMADGLTVSRAVAMLERMRANGDPIVIEESDGGGRPRTSEAPNPPIALVKPLFNALVAMDSARADAVLEQAFALYTTPTVYIEVVTPALVAIGDAWHNGTLFIASEHFATNYLRGRLLALLRSFPQQDNMPSVFVGCAPNEQHEMGALIFAVLLRQQGYNVIYLGQDVPIDDAIETAIHERPAMLCLSAGNPATALLLRSVQARLSIGTPPTPLFGYGGRAFDLDPELRASIAGHYLGVDPRQSLALVHSLLSESRDPHNGRE